jgi:hypothetical protein
MDPYIAANNLKGFLTKIFHVMLQKTWLLLFNPLSKI